MRNLYKLAALLTAAVCFSSPLALRAQAALQDPQAVIGEVESFLLSRAQELPGTPNVSVTPPRISNQPGCDQLENFSEQPTIALAHVRGRAVHGAGTVDLVRAGQRECAGLLLRHESLHQYGRNLDA